MTFAARPNLSWCNLSSTSRQCVCFGNYKSSSPVIWSLQDPSGLKIQINYAEPLTLQQYFASVGFCFMVTVSCNLTRIVGKPSPLWKLKRAGQHVHWTAIIPKDEYADSAALTEESSKVSGQEIHEFNWKHFKEPKLLWRGKLSVNSQYLGEVLDASFNLFG